ncbi:hypothetical protein BDV95DRAFT_315729 [Massariosphaeria phaeospora]|uniref:NAD(P)-binding protein n=1 Tax=Massariosphaeria phaeospora TaxID=100035 RepID=A0A7C8MCU3_9PLEO|nr:hypothetical protein BDV95DRAFT_315729 [Massariosphaeria phaeospora]
MPSFDRNTTDAEVLQTFGAEAKGKTFLITGPSKGGIGAQVAFALASSASPSLLILAGRSAPKITPVIDAIKASNAAVRVEHVQLDLSSHASVRSAVAAVKKLTTKIDVLVNNAGVMAPRTFALSSDGVESQFAVNYLGHFLLTNLLIGEGVVGAGGVVLNVGSLGYQLGDIAFDDVNFQNGENYNGWKAYGQAKSAQLLGTRGLANRLKGKNITVLIAHPGVTLESQLLANSAIDEAYFSEAYALAIARNNGHSLPPQRTVSLAQAAGVLLNAALNPDFRCKVTYLPTQTSGFYCRERGL